MSPKKLHEQKITRLNNFFHTLLDMPKEAGFSTQLPNLMMDALLFNDSKMIKKAITVQSQGASEAPTTSPNYKDTTRAATSQETTTSSSSSGSSVASAETLETFENIPTPTLMSKGSTIPLTKKKIIGDTAITVGK
jgi:hypothetical protein